MSCAESVQRLPSALPGLTALALQSQRAYPRHSHDVYGVGLIDAGAQRSASGRGPVEARAGQLISVSPGEVHDGVASDPSLGRRWRMLYLEPQLLGALLRDLQPEATRIELLTPPVFDAQPVRMALQQVWDLLAPSALAAAEQHLAQEAALLILTRALLPLAGRCPANEDSAQPELVRVRERLHDELQRPPTLEALARDSGLSRFQLLRAFTRQYGLPPHAYLLQQRLALARRAIEAGQGLADAAQLAGFADQAHLSRLFKRQWGISPGQFRAARGQPR